MFVNINVEERNLNYLCYFLDRSFLCYTHYTILLCILCTFCCSSSESYVIVCPVVSNEVFIVIVCRIDFFYWEIPIMQASSIHKRVSPFSSFSPFKGRKEE